MKKGVIKYEQKDLLIFNFVYYYEIRGEQNVK